MDLGELNQKTFDECRRTAFQILIPGYAPVPVELTDVTERNDSPKLEQFSLTFHNVAGVHLPQAIYDLEHEKLGRISLFLVPLGPRDGQGMDYQAVFNRIRKKDGSAA
jgi:hypothetical protein